MCLGGGEKQEVEQTEDQIAQQQINVKLWNYYQEKYRPLDEQYAKKVTSPEVQAEEERQIAGRINAEVMKNVRSEKVSSNPLENVKTLTDVAKTEAGAKVQGQGAVKSRQLGELQNIIDIGRGEATTAEVGLGELASQSVGTAISEKEAQQEETAAKENVYGSVAGAIAGGLLRAPKTTMKPKTMTVDPYG